jgi:mRNA guanylyltransferase
MSVNLNNMLSKKRKADEKAASERPVQSAAPPNAHLKHPVVPEKAISIFLTQACTVARDFYKDSSQKQVEVEARIGILKSPTGFRDKRVASSGPKHVGNQIAHAFQCHNCIFETGITRSHHLHWTQGGLSEVSPLSQAFGCHQDIHIKRDLVETEMVETVYSGYEQDRRVCFPGLHPSTKPIQGKMEHKEKLIVMDLALPAAPYDMRITLAAEKPLDSAIQNTPPPNWKSKRVKRRRSYTRRDKSIAWQLDVTEVTTSYVDTMRHPDVSYEIEMELNANTTQQLVNEKDEKSLQKLITQLSQQLWWMMRQINPLSDIMDVDGFLRDHPDKEAVTLAQAQCGALKRFMDGDKKSYRSPIGSPDSPSASLANVKFVGCMPVNFSRHNIEEVQRSPENGYFLSEKTDGVRHFLIFTGKTAVLMDRAMRGKQPIPRPGSNTSEDPFAPILSLIKTGTVLDGEVVMHRKLRRPIFIVFDVLTLSETEPILHLPFEQRLQNLRRASFRTATANRDMFAESSVMDPKIALPLVRKNFVKRLELDDLLSHVVEERGTRTYRNGAVHDHLTDGIIFQPNLPYVCGTDVNLLKWKYLDTVTIDVEILPSLHTSDNDQDVLRVGVLGEEQTLVDMTRFVKLPSSELRRLEADREETGSRIAEVGFDQTTGEWYYLTMRPDKIAPNHISTVLGTLLELAESLTTEELRYRMSVPVGVRDTYRKDVRGMQKQLLEHQRKKNKAAAAQSSL